MSFHESVIIPLELFKKCKFEEAVSLNKHSKILDNPSLTADEKMKLFYQDSQFKKTKLAPLISPDKQFDPTIFNSSIPERYRPYAESILKFIREYPEDVGWDKDYQIKIKSVTIPFSHLGKSLQHFMKNTVITKDSDVPPGTHALLERLLELGMPKTWVPAKIGLRKSSRDTKQLWSNWK